MPDAPDRDLSPLGGLLLRASSGDRSEADKLAVVQLVRPAVLAAPDDTQVPVALRPGLTPLAGLRHQVAETNLQWVGLNDLAVLADAVGLLTEADVDALLATWSERFTWGLRRRRIGHLVAQGRLDDAHAEAELLKEPIVGHRDVGRHLALAGDHERFFAEWPRLEPRRKTAELVELREELVAAVARMEGWRAALSLVETHKRLGERYVFAVLSAGQVAAYGELEQLLTGELGDRLDDTQKLQLLVDQLLREVPRAEGEEPEDARVLALAERIGELTGDRETVRARDWMLVRLWPVVGAEATLRRIRALIRTPNLRRELTMLPRDVPSP